MTTTTETKTVTEFAKSINSHISSATKCWVLVTRDFLEANEALDNKRFKQLRKETRFSYSTVCKLIKIAESDRVEQYEHQLSLIDAWSTLHEIVKLDDEQFSAFTDLYLSSEEPRYFKRSDVENFKNGGEAKKRSEFNVFATVRVKLTAMDSRKEFDEIQKRVNELTKQLSSSNVEIKFADLEKKLDKQFKSEPLTALAA